MAVSVRRIFGAWPKRFRTRPMPLLDFTSKELIAREKKNAVTEKSKLQWNLEKVHEEDAKRTSD